MVDVTDAVAAPKRPPPGRLRDRFLEETGRITLGAVQARGQALCLGPLTLLRFGPAEDTADGVRWPIQGGLLAARPGGEIGLRWIDGRLEARVCGYTPRLPMPVYRLTQLPIHRTVTRLFLLRMRGRDPLPGPPAGRCGRLAAGAIDAALCLAVARAAGRRRWPAAALGVAAGYHLAAWSGGGRTVGGALLGQRVVSLDGAPLTWLQALARLVTLPVALVTLHPTHDGFAGTEVIREAGPAA